MDKSKYGAFGDIPGDHEDRETVLRLLDEIAEIHDAPLDTGEDVARQINTRAHEVGERLNEVKTLVPTVMVSVADGLAVYAVMKCANGWTMLEWVDGGADRYIGPFGATVAVPEDVVTQLIDQGRRIAELFGG